MIIFWKRGIFYKTYVNFDLPACLYVKHFGTRYVPVSGPRFLSASRFLRHAASLPSLALVAALHAAALRRGAVLGPPLIHAYSACCPRGSRRSPHTHGNVLARAVPGGDRPVLWTGEGDGQGGDSVPRHVHEGRDGGRREGGVCKIARVSRTRKLHNMIGRRHRCFPFRMSSVADSGCYQVKV